MNSLDKKNGLKGLREKVASLPGSPGVYLMKSAAGKIIYVGKAKNLINRVRSYFIGVNQHPPKTRVLVQEISDFEIIITSTEVEALLLERTLIKHHAPCYNILLRDDKEYPFLRVNFQEDWPRVEIVRRQKSDGAYYIGPFGSSRSLRILLDTAHRIFPLIRCSRHQFSSVKRPCNYYHMKTCLGPCHIPTSRDDYVTLVKNALLFIQGKNSDLTALLKERMKEASSAQNYELAAMYRDQLKALDEISHSRQSAIVKNVKDADVLGLHQEESKTSFHILMVRDGRLIGSDSFVVDSLVQGEAEALSDFLLQYYESRSLPSELILSLSNETVEGVNSVKETVRLILESLKTEKSKLPNIEVIFPKRGPRLSLIEIAKKNAKYNLEESRRLETNKHIELELVQMALGLDRIPKKIECIDISNLQGTAIVASDVCFLDGKPAKDLYRHYVVKSVEGKPDDFASVREIVRRRFARAERDQDAPDLLVIDGGKGQLGAAMEAASEFQSLSIPIISLAKERGDQEASSERVFFPNRDNPFALLPGSQEYRVLTHLRDEAHRFAISHHRKRRSRILHASELEEIPGIGPSLRAKLLDVFGGVDGLKRATLEQLLAVKGLRESSAIALYARFQQGDE